MNELQSHGGYATEALFKNWIRFHSYDNWGLLKVNEEGIKFSGRKSNLVIPIKAIKKVSLVRKNPGPRMLYPFVIVIICLLLTFINLLKLDLLDTALLLFLLMLVFYFDYLLSNWVKVNFEDGDNNRVLYFSVSWNVGLYPFWRMWTDSSFLSWQDNRRLFNILHNSILKSGR